MSEEVAIDSGSEIAQTPPGGLLSGIKRESNTATLKAEHTSTPAQDNSWYWDEGMPGQGDRPVWLDPKYKSVADKARAHTEAEKKLGQIGSAPESYDFGNYQEVLDTSSPHLQKFMETAKKNRLPQETFQEIIGTLVEYEQSKMPQRDTEIAKLGPGAHEKIETVKRWASNNLSQEACDILGQIGDRAEVIKFVDELRQLHIHQASQPPGASDPGEGFVRLTMEDWEAELQVPANANRYVSDPKYRQEMQRKLKIIHGED